MTDAIILIVEDNDTDAEDARRRLREWGFSNRIVHCHTAAETMNAIGELKIADEQIALALVDARLPDEDGLELIKRLDCETILLTGYGDSQLLVSCFGS